MKNKLKVMTLLTLCLVAQVTEAKIIKCSYTSKKDSLTTNQIISDSLIIDTSITGTKFGEALATRELLDNGLLKIYSSGEDMNGISISLDLKNAGTIGASSVDSSGNMKSSVHLNYVQKNKLGLKIFNSIKCEFIHQ